MIILALDTSGQGDQVGIFEAGKPRGILKISQEQHTSKTILSNIHEVLESAKLQLEQIDLLALTTGPGSFTGIRVGISVTKAFQKIHSTPAVGVSSLAALVFPFRESQQLLVPCIQARNEEVYAAAYRWNLEQNKLETFLAEKLWLLSDLMGDLQRVSETKLVIGSGAIAHRENFVKNSHFQIPEGDASHTIHILSVAQLAEKEWLDRQGNDLPPLHPNYLRPSEAELKWVNNNKIKSTFPKG